MAHRPTDTELLRVLEELKSREPIFHTRAFGRTRTDFEKATAPDYWEVGASGRRYSRKFILEELERNPPPDADESAWQIYDFAIRKLCEDIFLATYTLRQNDRVTRRATIWQKVSDGWQILYHQGTVAAEEEDDSSGWDLRKIWPARALRS